MTHLPRKALAALALTGALAATPAAAQPAQADAALTERLEGRVAGDPVDCLQLRPLDNSEIVPGTGILFRVGSTLYLNRLRGPTGRLDGTEILVTQPFGSQLCRLDRVQLIDRNSGFASGLITLDRFIPYRRAD